MTREQTAVLALLIARDIGREGDSPEGLAEAALQYASACGWHPIDRVMVVPSKAAAGLESTLAEIRASLTIADARVSALEVALAGVIGAATSWSEDALTEAIDAAVHVLGG